MSGLKHDAKVCRASAKSEQVRLNHGFFTPAELAAQAEDKKLREQKKAKQAAKGTPLGLEEEA